MQVTINLEKELWEAAQKKALTQKVSVDKAMSQLLRLGLAAETNAKGKAAFTFSLPGKVVTSNDVRAMLEDDDE